MDGMGSSIAPSSDFRMEKILVPAPNCCKCALKAGAFSIVVRKEGRILVISALNTKKVDEATNGPMVESYCHANSLLPFPTNNTSPSCSRWGFDFSSRSINSRG